MNLEDCKNENGTYNGIRALSMLSGIAENSVAEMAKKVQADVRENRRKLDGCMSHVFAPPTTLFQRRRTCVCCSGEVDSQSAEWYELGRKHEFDGIAREVRGG